MHLITGGTGMVGAHIAVALAEKGERVRLLIRAEKDIAVVERILAHYGMHASMKQLEWVEGDLLDPMSLSEAMQGIQHVYHSAALISFSPRDGQNLFETNVTGTANMVNAALEQGVQRFCHISSIAALGPQQGSIAVDENTPWNDDIELSDYAQSKYEAELEIHRGVAEGLNAFMVEPSVIIGPGRAGRSTRTLIDRIGEGTRFFPPGSTHVVDVRDVAEASIALMERAGTGDRYVIAGPASTYEALFKSIATTWDSRVPNIRLRPWMLGLAWRASGVWSLLTGTPALVTKQTVATALKLRAFDDGKLRECIGIRFRSMPEMVENAVRFARDERRERSK